LRDFHACFLKVYIKINFEKTKLPLSSISKVKWIMLVHLDYFCTYWFIRMFSILYCCISHTYHLTYGGETFFYLCKEQRKHKTTILISVYIHSFVIITWRFNCFHFHFLFMPFCFRCIKTPTLVIGSHCGYVQYVLFDA